MTGLDNDMTTKQFAKQNFYRETGIIKIVPAEKTSSKKGRLKRNLRITYDVFN